MESPQGNNQKTVTPASHIAAGSTAVQDTALSTTPEQSTEGTPPITTAHPTNTIQSRGPDSEQTTTDQQNMVSTVQSDIPLAILAYKTD